MNFSVEKWRSKGRKHLFWLLVGNVFLFLVPISGATSQNSSPSASSTPSAGATSGKKKLALKVRPASASDIPRLPANSSPETHLPAVLLKHGTLQVEADNSELTQILSQIATVGGMTIDGSVPSVRVYGNYGPGNSRAVLTDLLTGLGYNFMMIGTTSEGVPKKLLLTARSNQPVSAPTAPYAPAPSTPTASPNDADQPGPGAIVNVPPAGSDDPQERAQQNLQRLQQMHDQQSKPAQPQ